MFSSSPRLDGKSLAFFSFANWGRSSLAVSL